MTFHLFNSLLFGSTEGRGGEGFNGRERKRWNRRE